MLKPREKLRFEPLRARYTVSFSTLREALSRLAAESLVVAKGQRGFIVAPVSIEDMNDQDGGAEASASARMSVWQK